MASSSGDRSAFFPAIEKKHGKPASHWLKLLQPLGGRPYTEQMSLLQDTHGFSRTHANALVMHFRGSTTSRRFDSPDAYFTTLTDAQAALAHAIFGAITKKFPKLELVIAWNQPILRMGDQYVFGLSTSANHLTINPWSTEVLEEFRPRLTNLVINKHTIQIPLDWKVNASVLQGMVKARLAEIAAR